MKYLPRRLAVTTADGRKEISEQEFLALDGPLVVLGEPGAGKSAFVKQVEMVDGALFYPASALSAFPNGISSDAPSRVIIDALDEVTAYTPGAPIVSVLSKILNTDVSKFVFTCRAVDWNNEVNSTIFLNRWKKLPIVGTLLPLNDREIIAFVDGNGTGKSGQDFLRGAVEHDSVELLRNPQMLVMLMETVKRTGWPKTRIGLYEETCKALVEEHTSFHRSSDYSYSNDDKMRAAGSICAQAILSNKVSITLDGSSGESRVSIIELITDKFDAAVIRSALSTKIFKGFNETSVECSHRTILEYLGARFITSELRNTLSLRRLETVMYATGYIVPPALRGLHAWIATMDNGEISRALIDRDPYGVFRYGDPAVLSVELSRRLLQRLRTLSYDDPYFRNEDWHVRVGRGFPKPALKEDIISLLKEPGIPFEMKHLVVQSLRGSGFEGSLKKELIEVVLNSSEIFVVRDGALAVLQDDQVQANWKKLVKELRAINNMDSLRLALDILQSSIDEFSGSEIAAVLIAISNASRRGTLYAGLGYGLPSKMSSAQLLDALNDLLLYRFDENLREPMHDDPKDWILQIFLKCFERSAMPQPKMIWLAFNKLRRHSHSKWKELQEEATKYFELNPDTKLAVQWEGLFGSGKEVSWSNFFRLQESCRSLVVVESDLLEHLARVVRDGGELFSSRWQILAWYAVRNPSFTKAIEKIGNQTVEFPELAGILKELENPHDRSWESQERRETRLWEKQQNQKVANRRARYSEVSQFVIDGSHLEAISFIAQAFLNWGVEVKGDDPEQRVADLVGDKNKEMALKSISTAVSKARIPTVREITDKHLGGNISYIEPILVAYCAQAHDKSKIPMNILLATLAACGVQYHTDDITPEVQAEIEAIVFNDAERKESFLRDTFERQLSSADKHISGLERLATDHYFSDIAGRLSIEWLTNYEHESEWVTEQLLRAALRYSTIEEVTSLVINKSTRVETLPKTQRYVWVSLLFFIDFDRHQKKILSDLTGDCKKFWVLKNCYSKYFRNQRLSLDQNYFIIKHFSPCFLDDESVPNGFMGGEHPWEASEFLLTRANDLAADLSSHSSNVILKLLSELQPATRFFNHLKHVFSQHTRWKAEQDLRDVSLQVVKSILFGRSPSSSRDLQAITLDMLADYQRLLHGSPTDDYKVFWKDNFPHSENYCRNRIVQNIDPLLNRLAVRAHVESQMPNVKRCDFLNTFANMDVPVEVKGQWNKDVWTAAIDQLEDYSREHRADGYGIYLVLWFGAIPSFPKKNPTKDKLKRVPKTADEMRQLLVENYKGKISEKTKVFVLDVSKPKNLPRQTTKKISISNAAPAKKATSRKTRQVKKTLVKRKVNKFTSKRGAKSETKGAKPKS